MSPDHSARVLVIGTGFGLAVHVPALRDSALVGQIFLARGRPGPIRDCPQDVVPVEDWRAALDQMRFDLVIAAIPPLAQTHLAQEIAGRGIPLLLEKPGGMSSADLARLTKAVEADIIKIGYGFRFARGLQQLLQLTAAGAIGAVRNVDVRWITSGWADPDRPWSWRCEEAAGGGVLRDVACHSLDYILKLCSAPVTKIAARAKVSLSHRRDMQGIERPVTAPDWTDVQITFADDAEARLTIANAAATAEGHRVEVTGTSGKLVWSHAAPFAIGQETLSLSDYQKNQAIDLPLDTTKAADARIPATTRMIEDVLGAGGTCATLHEAAGTLALLEEIETLSKMRAPC